MIRTKDASQHPVTPLGRESIIEVRRLRSEFASESGKTTVIHENLDLTVMRGEILTLVGGSGTGKTVLLRQILGLERPSAGSITIMGQPVARVMATGSAARVGMLFQQGALFTAFTVEQNIALPLLETRRVPVDLARDAARLKLRMVGLSLADAQKFPAELSGGMIKRVALARALIMDPQLLMLDEPTAGLDPHGAEQLCELLAQLHSELSLTVVMVTHDVDALMRLSMRVAVLASRRVIIEAPVPEVLAFDHPFIKLFFHGSAPSRALYQNP